MNIEYRKGKMTATDSNGRVIFVGSDTDLLGAYAELREAVRRVGASVLNDWRGNDGSLRVDTMHRLTALLRMAGSSDLLWEGARTYEVVS